MRLKTQGPLPLGRFIPDFQPAKMEDFWPTRRPRSPPSALSREWAFCFFSSLRTEDLVQRNPGVPETIDWAKNLALHLNVTQPEPRNIA